MPSFLSKVFGRKKDEKPSNNKRHSTGSLLEGKFEVVSPTVSPTASNFAETAQQPKEKDKDVGFSLFRPRSRTSPKSDSSKSSSPAPHLTLNLPVPKEDKSRALGVVFEADPNDRSTLSDALIGERRLNPLEALLLVKACATAIVERGGLETLGIMHPHWYSASEETQRRLISLFILSLAPKSQSTTLSPPRSSPSLVFESEVEYTRSIHDLAAVLRWALRHLRLEGSSFGTKGKPNEVDDQTWLWYTQFSEAERTASYPVNAFTQALVPQVPPAHLQLLTATLDIISSLAAHAETNGSSGSKLTKFFGLWLLTTTRSQDADDWSAFYSRWERAGRILEHVFLSYVRDEAANNRMPLRLEELVKNYPYSKESTSDNLLPRPRFSTRSYDALFVRLETQLPDSKYPKPKQHPLRIIAEAFKAEVESGNASAEIIELWEQIKKYASPVEGTATTADNVGYPTFSKIFSEDTLRLLSLIPVDRGESSMSPVAASTSAPVVTSPTRTGRRRSSSLGSTPNGNGKATSSANGKTTPNGNGSTATPTTATSPVSPTSPTDWADFSSAGFGESSLGRNFASTLLDSEDVEVTTPTSSKKAPLLGSPQKKKQRTAKAMSPVSRVVNRRSSSDNPRPLQSRPTASELAASKRAQADGANPLKMKAKKVRVVQLDEAFIDFWSDALLDPIAANWPTFFLCQLKPGVGLTTKSSQHIGWLIVEHAFAYPSPPPIPPIPSDGEPLFPKRPSSPKPSLKSNVSGRKSSTFSFASRRFSFLNRSEGNKSPIGGVAGTKKKGAAGVGSPRAGEMGEMLPEEEEPSPVKEKTIQEANVKGLGISGVGSSPAPATSSSAVPESETSATSSRDPDVSPSQPIPVVSIQPPSVPESVASSTVEGIQDSAQVPETSVIEPEPVVVDEPIQTTGEVEEEQIPQTPRGPGPRPTTDAPDVPGTTEDSAQADIPVKSAEVGENVDAAVEPFDIPSPQEPIPVPQDTTDVAQLRVDEEPTPADTPQKPDTRTPPEDVGSDPALAQAPTAAPQVVRTDDDKEGEAAQDVQGQVEASLPREQGANTTTTLDAEVPKLVEPETVVPPPNGTSHPVGGLTESEEERTQAEGSDKSVVPPSGSRENPT